MSTPVVSCVVHVAVLVMPDAMAWGCGGGAVSVAPILLDSAHTIAESSPAH
ncbi:hypothetical protein GH868_30320 [Bacillus thuringiensis]|nr:hypothetical protein [Bacillus thuringiensis]